MSPYQSTVFDYARQAILTGSSPNLKYYEEPTGTYLFWDGAATFWRSDIVPESMVFRHPPMPGNNEEGFIKAFCYWEIPLNLATDLDLIDEFLARLNIAHVD
jgi:hypothetical protein